ncbi:65-kDa microtubule-associated protein 3-like isoform X1 [Vigna umbellata]|uniref:65-kDa microtubule-associated protein 3-like isoform X1 n=1 Tax=Vigna umbellata TaxID=87088 RepID=UPI001F5F8CE3|nr:65-kDa microtubule-associated protein 3-like isoform X1 [Vigna umbellata]
MARHQKGLLLQSNTTCESLLNELQIIWNEVGESETEKDRMLYELEEECVEVYRRKVDKANRSRAQLRQEIADSEAELACICSTMGERPVHFRQFDKNAGSLKEELARVHPELEEMRKRKFERRNQFIEVQEQIQSISNEICSTGEYITAVVDETDLSLRKLEELHRELLALQKEKSERLKKVQDQICTLNSLCSVLGLDFKQTVSGVHPSLGISEGPRSVNSETINQLAIAIQELRKVKLQRMQRLQDLASTMLELWNLMDTPVEEQQMFQNVTCNIAASEDEVTEPNSLSENFINYVEAEVSRLEELKSSKMKELVLRKRAELEEICHKTHLIPKIDSAVEQAVEAIESGVVDPACVLEQLELQIASAKEEAFVRKEILEKVEKWLAAREEESWLEEYNMDENRYNAGKGSHLTLKRAEKARALVSKLPAMVEALTSKTIAWEKDKGIEFTYDGTCLISMLENYSLSRQEKEQERRRQRELKKLQGQMTAEKEVLYGSKVSPSKAQSAKKTPRAGSAACRKISLGCQTPKSDSKPYQSQSSFIKRTDKAHQNDRLNNLDDDVSYLSSARRGLDTAREMESPSTRQPFSPISLTVSSKANDANAVDDIQNKKLPNTLVVSNFPSITTTSKTTTVVDEENRTPMNTSMTPTPAAVPY